MKQSTWAKPTLVVLASGSEAQNPNTQTGPKQAQNPEGVGSTGGGNNAFPGQEEEDAEIIGAS